MFTSTSVCQLDASARSRQISDGNYAEKRAIPRFASFKPNTTSEIQRQETGDSENIHWVPRDRDGTPDESRSRRQKQKLGRHHSRGHYEPGLKKGLDGQVRSKFTKQETDPHENISKSFIVDRVGDLDNLKFGTPDRYATASYFRFGAGNVLGSPADQRIDRAVSTGKALVLSDDTHGLPKSKGKILRWRLDEEGARELKIKPQEEHDPVIDSDYVSMGPAQRAKRRGNDGLPVYYASSSDEHDMHYRSVEGKAKSKREPADQDLKYNSDTSSSQDIAGSRLLALDESARWKRVQLSRRVDAEPANFEAWMDLISYQDSMLGLGQASKRTSLTNAERRSNAEIKLSMFEKALEKVRDPQGCEVLLLGMMQEATKIWEKDKISLCWKRILQKKPQNLRLWAKFIDFMQTDFTSFRFEEVRNAYLNCLSINHVARTSGEMSMDKRNQVFEIQIYLVLRMTLFMRESGFTEHATAAWQALLEFVFFKPIIVQVSHDNKDRPCDEAIVSMFENFWESEVPRIGEEGAEGWASFNQKQGKPPQPRTETADGLKDSKDHWKSWLASERRHRLLSRNPARTIDDIEENDPYRIILFSDIRPFLIDPPSLAGRRLILEAFFSFCYLPTFAADSPDSRLRSWEREGFLRNDALRLSNKLQGSWKLRVSKERGSSEGQDSIDKRDYPLHSGTQGPFQFPIPDYQVSSDSLFAEKQWFSALNTWQEQCSGDGGPVEVAWVLRSLKSLISIDVVEEALAVFVLALELRTSPGTVRKTAKNILKKRPFSIHLYNAYALIEYRLADVKRGEGIITTSINMSKKLDEVSQRDAILLWRTWTWETLGAKSAQEALLRLLAIGDEEIQMSSSKLHLLDRLGSAKPALLLRTERAFVAIRDRMLSLRSYIQATFAIECLMLFAYLRNAQSLSAATSAFKSNIALLSTHVSSTSSNHEHLHQSFARLLYHHATHTHIFKPSDIRSLLAEAMAEFPHNTIFLSLYAWNEARFRIDDRLRSVVQKLVLGGSRDTGNNAQDSVVPHFFAVYSELHRAVTFGSNLSTIRSTFERAVESESGAHCAGLWNLYFLFEHSRRETERAKLVFWRGLRACPWVKDLYMLAFDQLRSDKVMDEADLRGIYELLGEKELRVHVGIE